jgi:hypothetical protein
MQATNTALRFQHREELPSARALIELLNELDEARQAKDHHKADRLEEYIKGIVPESVLYQGFVDDEVTVSVVCAGQIVSKGDGANAHTFYIRFEVIENLTVTQVREMELKDFLVREDFVRVLSPVKTYRGPRFVPF